MYYTIAQVDIIDPDGFRRYVEGHAPTVERHGGRFLAAGGEVAAIEGDLRPGVLVIHQWPDRATFEAWYGSDDYRPWRELRWRSARTSVLATEGKPG